jgi:hypothetical protein
MKGCNRHVLKIVKIGENLKNYFHIIILKFIFKYRLKKLN